MCGHQSRVASAVLKDARTLQDREAWQGHGTWRACRGPWQSCARACPVPCQQGDRGTLFGFLISIAGIVTPTLCSWNEESVRHPRQTRAV